MAIYHLHIKNISRSHGRSIVAAAAYRAGETLPNEAEERDSAFGGRRDVLHAEIRLPAEAPDWMAERAALWNGAEAAEKRKDARLAKEIEFSLPRELPRDQWIAVARAMADAYAAQGFVADVAVHDNGTAHNPHVHLLLTTRLVTKAGFGPKIRSADGVQFVTQARTLWARIANQALGLSGSAATIDSRSDAARGLDHTPARHRGPDKDERRMRRAEAQQQRDAMTGERDPEPTVEELPASRIPDADLPVPDPDGFPIHPDELHRAEDRMLNELHGPMPPESAGSSAESEVARGVIERQSAVDVREDDAYAYRLAPFDDHLDWLRDPVTPVPEAGPAALRVEDHLDWLDRESLPSQPEHDDEPVREPERRRS